MHQLASSLNHIGIPAYLVYYENGLIVTGTTPVPFHIYAVNSSTEVKDEPTSWVILPEVYLHIGKKYLKAKMICWWLSVDNFFYDGLGSAKDAFKWNKWFGIKRIIKQYILGSNYNKGISLKSLANEKYLHLYQSYYAKMFLQSNGIQHLKSLGDYINLAYLETSSSNAKEDLVLYNPKKLSIKFKKIMQVCTEIKWVPLENMTIAQMTNMYSQAKLYVDFGYHPGKDRIPREAVIHQCCLLTNKQGSAKYYEDIPIQEKYKISDADLSVELIRGRIHEIFTNYAIQIHDFENYRQIIKEEKALFDKEVQFIFKS
jgi:hypothetical protein